MKRKPACRICGSVAVHVDVHYPYDTLHNRCEEHKNVVALSQHHHPTGPATKPTKCQVWLWYGINILPLIAVAVAAAGVLIINLKMGF